MQIICTVVAVVVIVAVMFILMKKMEKDFIKELQKLTISVNLQPVLDKIEEIKPCDFSEIIDEIKKIDNSKKLDEISAQIKELHIPETDLEPILKAIKELEAKVESGEVEIKNGVINGDLLVTGDINARGNVAGFCEEE